VHNSLFLIAHFHNVIIGGVLFGYFAGIIYWFPKVFGFHLDEKWGKRSFYCWVCGFYLAFMPLYIVGLNGFMRRTDHYDNVLYQPYLIAAAAGACLISIGILFQIIQLIVSIRKRKQFRDHTGDFWNARTLEWTVSSPAPIYNFAFLPTVSTIDQFWYDKERQIGEERIHPQDIHYQPIHMPKNTPLGFIIAIFSGVFGFALIWHMWLLVCIGLIGMIATVIARTFSTDTDYYIDAETVKATEIAHFKEGVHA